jgi:hypothetical protein
MEIRFIAENMPRSRNDASIVYHAQLRTCKSVLNRLHIARTFDDLNAVIEQVKSELPLEEANILITSLKGTLDSTERLTFSPNWKSKHQFGYQSLDGTFYSKRHPLDALYYHTVQQIETMGGRHAWCLERILAIDLPPLPLKPKKQRQSVMSKITELVESQHGTIRPLPFILVMICVRLQGTQIYIHDWR